MMYKEISSHLVVSIINFVRPCNSNFNPFTVMRNPLKCTHNMQVFYLLAIRGSYGPTAQNLEDCLIFFIQPNHVYKIKKGAATL